MNATRRGENEPVAHIIILFFKEKVLEAWAGIEPACTDLQSAA